MKYIICGPFTNETSEKYMDVLPAAGKFLYNLSSGLECNGYEVIRAVYIPYDIKPGHEKMVETAYSNDQIVVRRGHERAKSTREYQKQILECVDRDTIVIFYNVNYSLFGLYEAVVKKGGKPLLILADHGHSSACKNIKRKIYAMMCEHEFKKFDKVIQLSAETKVKFKNDADRMVLEGGINYDEFKHYEMPVRRGKLYYTSTGSLKPLLGVDMLLKTIAESKRKDFVFTFSGRGESVPDIEKAAQIDTRIVCKGFLSRKEYSEMMSQTNVFVSARNMEFEKNNNSFPSKILEYLATGRIIVSIKFPGYQKFQKSIIFYNGTEDELLSIMDKIADNYDELARKYYIRNRKFAMSFDWKNQAKKIVDFMED